LSGAAAMHVFRAVWESAVSRDKRHTIFGFDREADVNATRLGYRLFSKQVPAEEQAGRIGLALHYAYGSILGILYRITWSDGRSDAALGALLWLCADEIPIAVSGISDPFAKSAASHTSAFAAHLIFVGVTGRITRVLQSGRNRYERNQYA
jgi:hypothetical protein